MTEPIEQSATFTIESKLRLDLSKFASYGRIALKVIIGFWGLMIGCFLGFILALVFGFIDFVC